MCFLFLLQGEVKRPESFWSTVMSIWRVIGTTYGNVRLDFGQPFSLQVGIRQCYKSLPPYQCLKNSQSAECKV